MMNAYVIGLLPFIFIWGLIYYSAERFRKKMLYSSLICMPFGALDILFIPEYWHPPSLFGLTPPIESFAFAFLFGGIASSIYEFSTSRKLEEIGKEERNQYYSFETHAWEKWTITLLGIPLLYFGLGLSMMSTSLIVIFVLAVVGLYQRKDLLRKAVFSAFFLTGFYLLVILFLKTFLFPDMFQNWWNHENLVGVYFLGIPVEELVFAMDFGLFFSPLYEIGNEKKIISKFEK